MFVPKYSFTRIKKLRLFEIPALTYDGFFCLKISDKGHEKPISIGFGFSVEISAYYPTSVFEKPNLGENQMKTLNCQLC